MMNFKFVLVNYQYINYLHKFDYKVQLNNKELNKDNKPFLGFLFSVNPNINYYVPLSSKKDKHKKMKNSSDFHKIIDLDTNELLSVINFNNMIL